MLSRAVLPGSFAPLHHGHLAMAHYAESRGALVIFEISCSNVDKPSLTEEEKIKRQAQFYSLRRDVIFTNRPTFVQKCYIARFCGELYEEQQTRAVTFLIGSDTLSRIQDKKYYFNSEKEMERCLAIITKSGCDFCVFERESRVEPHPIIANIVEYADIKIPNISSTELRKVFTIDIRDFVPNTTLDKVQQGTPCYVVLNHYARVAERVIVRPRKNNDLIVVQLGEEFIYLKNNTMVMV